MSIAYWCVLIAGMMPVLTVGIAKAGRHGYDNAEPRAWLERQQGYRHRADHAHRNHFEAFPFFAVAVLIAEQVQGDPMWIDGLAVGFIAARLLYTVLYLANQPTLRSLAWGLAYFCILALFGVAAHAP